MDIETGIAGISHKGTSALKSALGNTLDDVLS